MGCNKSKPVLSKKELQGTEQNKKEQKELKEFEKESANEKKLNPFTLTIVMLTTPDRFEFSALTIQRMKMYCDLHHYQLVVYENVLETTRAAPWSKIVALQKALLNSKTKFVAWIDDDIYVTNPFVSLSKLIEKTIDQNNLLLSEDAQKHNGHPVNTGVIILRNCDWSRDYLQTVWDQGISVAKECYWEQTTITNLLWQAPELNTKIAVLPMPVLQSFYRYPETQDPEYCTWSVSHFLCHLTGLPKEIRIDAVKHLEKQGLFPMIKPPLQKMKFLEMVYTQEKEIGNINR